jgi:predicted RNA methylase
MPSRCRFQNLMGVLESSAWQLPLSAEPRRNLTGSRRTPRSRSTFEFAEVIKRLTEDGSTVLDPFVGGGCVVAAALMLGRKFIGIDIDRKHIEGTRRRIEGVANGLEMIWGAG